jgi:hypothetical protein
LNEKAVQPLELGSVNPAALVNSEYGRIFVIWLVQFQFSRPAEPWAQVKIKSRSMANISGNI